MNTAIRYSEAFKQQVVDEIAKGKFSSAYRAQVAYGIKGNATVTKWVRKYGGDDLLPKCIRIETMEEKDQLKEARKRIKELEAALVSGLELRTSGFSESGRYPPNGGCAELQGIV